MIEDGDRRVGPVGSHVAADDLSAGFDQGRAGDVIDALDLVQLPYDLIGLGRSQEGSDEQHRAIFARLGARRW